jgi:hypothetical protein
LHPKEIEKERVLAMKLFNLNVGLNPGTILVGAAALVLGPMALTVAGGMLRSLAKTAVKGGIIAYERSKDLAEETKDTLEGITQEAKAELEGKVVTMKKKS